MNLSPYVESVRRGVTDAAALADDHTRQVAGRLGSAIESSTRLALIDALCDAADAISADLAPGSVVVRMSGSEPRFELSVPGTAAEPTWVLPVEPEEPAEDRPADRRDPDDEPIARISLRLPASVKARVDELADRDQISTNAWLLRAVMDALGTRRSDERPVPPEPPSPGPHGPFGPHGVFGPHGPFGPGGLLGARPDPADHRRGSVRGVGSMTFKNFVHEGVRGVQVENIGAGTISVEPGPRPDVVEGSVNVGDTHLLDQVVVRQEADQLRIIVPQRESLASPTHLRLGVPAGLGFSIRAGSATIAFTAEVDRAKIVSGSGDVSLDSVAELDCSTGSGAISVGRLLNRGARLDTGSGDISVAEARSPLTAKSGSGDIIVRSLRRADLAASSGSGDIAVPSTTGSVDLRSASGSLTVGVADDLPVWLDLNSVSGAVRIALDATAEPSPGEPYVSVRASTASGEIAVYRA